MLLEEAQEVPVVVKIKVKAGVKVLAAGIAKETTTLRPVLRRRATLGTRRKPVSRSILRMEPNVTIPVVVLSLMIVYTTCKPFKTTLSLAVLLYRQWVIKRINARISNAWIERRVIDLKEARAILKEDQGMVLVKVAQVEKAKVRRRISARMAISANGLSNGVLASSGMTRKSIRP